MNSFILNPVSQHCIDTGLVDLHLSFQLKRQKRKELQQVLPDTEKVHSANNVMMQERGILQQTFGVGNSNEI